MKLLRMLSISLALTSVVLAPRLGAAAKIAPVERLAIVDVQRCILETAEGKRAKKELEATFAKSQAQLERKAKDLEKRFRDMQAKASMLSQAELAKRQQELMRSQAELEQLGAELQQDVMGKEAILTESIYNKVAAIVKQIALEEKLQVVLVRTDVAVLFANPKLDITNRVIVAYDKNHK